MQLVLFSNFTLTTVSTKVIWCNNRWNESPAHLIHKEFVLRWVVVVSRLYDVQVPTIEQWNCLAVFGIIFHSRTRITKSYEQLENWSWLVKFRKPFVNWFSPSDGQENFGTFSTCFRGKNQFPYQTKMIPSSALVWEINTWKGLSVILGWPSFSTLPNVVNSLFPFCQRKSTVVRNSIYITIKVLKANLMLQH